MCTVPLWLLSNFACTRDWDLEQLQAKAAQLKQSTDFSLTTSVSKDC